MVYPRAMFTSPTNELVLCIIVNGYNFMTQIHAVIITDIDECINPNACGQNAICQNTIGNYTCVCPEGFAGNPYDGCSDVNECDHPNACGPGALCTNVLGGRQCHCPPGYEGDPYTTGNLSNFYIYNVLNWFCRMR